MRIEVLKCAPYNTIFFIDSKFPGCIILMMKSLPVLHYIASYDDLYNTSECIENFHYYDILQEGYTKMDNAVIGHSLKGLSDESAQNLKNNIKEALENEIYS